MNTPTLSTKNPIQAAWEELVLTVKPLARFLLVGFVLSLILEFSTNRFTGTLSFSSSQDPTFFPWVPLMIVSALALSWYGVHLLLALNHYRQHQKLLHATESIRFIPRVVGVAVLLGLIILLPIVFLVALAMLWVRVFHDTASAQDVITAASSSLDQVSATASSTIDALAGTIGAIGIIPILLALVVGIGWAIFASMRLSQASLAVLLEDKGVIDALKRSWELTKGSFWYVIGWGIVLGILSSIVTGLSTSLDSILGTASSGIAEIGFAKSAIQAFLMAPLAGYYSLNIFDNLKKRAASTK